MAASDSPLLRHYLENYMKRYPSDDVTSETSPRIKLLKDEGQLRNDTDTDGRKAQVVAADQPGELGRPVNVNVSQLSIPDRLRHKRGWTKYQFNEFVSKMISLRRTLPDVRHPMCRNITYPPDLPVASVVIIFYNEALSVLLRTIYSVLDRSPDHLLREILLIDDHSNIDEFPHLGSRLEEFVRKYPKLKLIRARNHTGLIHARMTGAKAATGDVVVFLDSHCEATKGWLEPLLARIHQRTSAVVAPVIDKISDDTFRYIPVPGDAVGGFRWDLTFSWQRLSDRVKQTRNSPIDPQPSPTIAGGLFAISKDYFTHIGMYDPGKRYWGMENLEISFKVWMCGGSLEQIPCSHVGHVFRKHSPYNSKELIEAVIRNAARLAEVWLDNYKYQYYKKRRYTVPNYGDVTSRRELRKRLNCRSFQWYLDTIYPEQEIPEDNFSNFKKVGQIRNEAAPLCIDASTYKEHREVSTWPCHTQGGNQFWFMSDSGQIGRNESCIVYTRDNGLFVHDCKRSKYINSWTYREDKHLEHNASGLCMELSGDGRHLKMSTCRPTSLQVWFWKWFQS